MGSVLDPSLFPLSTQNTLTLWPYAIHTILYSFHGVFGLYNLPANILSIIPISSQPKGWIVFKFLYSKSSTHWDLENIFWNKKKWWMGAGRKGFEQTLIFKSIYSKCSAFYDQQDHQKHYSAILLGGRGRPESFF